MDKIVRPGDLSSFKHKTWTGRRRLKWAARLARWEKKLSHRAMRRAVRAAERDGVDGSILIARGWWT